MELVKQQVFQYMILWQSTKEQSEKGQKSKVIQGLTTEIGADAKAVGMKAIKAIPAEYDEQLEQVEVAIKGF